MLIVGIFINILAIGLFKKYISFIFWNRISFLILLFSCILSFNSYYIFIFNTGISLYNGLWLFTTINGGISILIYIAGACIIMLGEGFIKKELKINLKKNIFFSNFQFQKNLLKFFMSEYPLIILFTTLGMICLITSNDLISFFLGIELQSLSCAPNEPITQLFITTFTLLLLTNTLLSVYRSHGCSPLSKLIISFAGIAEHKGLRLELAAFSGNIVQWFRYGYVKKLDTSLGSELGLRVLSRIVWHVYDRAKVYTLLSIFLYVAFLNRDSLEGCQLVVLSAISVNMMQGPNPKVVTSPGEVVVGNLVLGEVTASATKVPRSRKSRSSAKKEIYDNQVTKETSPTSKTNSNAPTLTGDSPMPNPRGGKGELFRAWLTLRLEKFRDKNDNRFNGLINILCDPDFLWASYELIKSNPDNMSHGIDKFTLDGFDCTWFQNLASTLKKGKFQFSPAKRVMIPKPGKLEKRPLGIGSPREKIVQKALQLVLETIWESIFSDSSHGFRPKRSIHTTLKPIYLNGSRYPWVIQGDISKCFDNMIIPHEIIMKRVREHIKCQRTLELIQSFLRAGYTLKLVPPKLGTPQ
jgi:hypothetical protein